MNVEVNYLAVMLSAIASMVIGFIWYSPLLFAKPWMKLMGYTSNSLKEAQKKMGTNYFLSFVLTLVSAYVLSHVTFLSQYFFKYDKLSTGLISAFWMWLGFVMPIQMSDFLFGGKKFKLFAINTGYQLASMIAMGLIIGLM